MTYAQAVVISGSVAALVWALPTLIRLYSRCEIAWMVWAHRRSLQ